jgi:hypothetical protein
LELSVKISAEINITIDEARRKVNGFLLDKLSYLMVSSRDAELAVGDKIVWRFSVNHTLPGFGNLGQIGLIEVDVETGEIQPVPVEQLEEMKRSAKALASSYPLDTTPAR